MQFHAAIKANSMDGTHRHRSESIASKHAKAMDNVNYDEGGKCWPFFFKYGTQTTGRILKVKPFVKAYL